MEPVALAAAIARHRRRRRLAALLAGAGAGATVAAATLPLLAWSDAALRPGDAARWACWGAAMALATAAAAVAGRGLLARSSDVALAGDLERRAGIGGGLLSAGASFASAPPRDASPWMIGRTVALAAQAAAAIADWRRISPLPRAWPAVGAGAAALILAAAAVPALAPWVARAAWPGSAAGRPGSLRIDAWPTGGQVVAGAEPVLGAQVSGDAKRVVATVVWDDGRDEERPLEEDPARRGSWSLTLPPVTCGLSWRVRADRDGDGVWDGEADRRRLTLAPGFSPGDVLVHITPPAYADLPAQTFSGDATALAGSTAAVEAAVADGGPRLAAATVVIEPEDGSPGREIPATVSGRTLRAQVPLRTAVRWGLRLIAAGGREELPDRRWRIAVVPDVPPAVRLEGAPDALAADGADAVTVVAEDDVGLTAVVLDIHREQPNGPLLASIDLAGDAHRRRGALALDAAALGAAPGDALVLIATATDRAGQSTRSAPAVVAIAGDGSDADRRLAARLAAANAALAAARARLPALALAWERSVQDRRVVAGRLAAWAEELAASTAAWEGAPATQTDSEARAALADIHTWAQAVAGGPADPAVLAVGLGQLADALAAHARRAQAAAAARLADAQARAVERHARALAADLAWGAKPAEGLAAAFSPDVDGAPASASAVEVPGFRNRTFPAALGVDNVRIAYRGLVRAPHAGAVLTVTADDGVRLRIDGADLLPPEAWGAHPATAWNSPPLAAGWHAIELAYRQGTGESFLALAWDGGAPVAAADLRTDDGLAELARTDTGAIDARARSLDQALERLAASDAAAAPRIAARRAAGAPWTAEGLAAAAADARSVADELAAVRVPEPPPARSAVPPPAAPAPRSESLTAGLHRARQDLGQAVSALALDLREAGEIEAAEDVERVDTVPAEPIAPGSDAVMAGAAGGAVERAAAGAGVRTAAAAQQEPAREAGARRLATAVERAGFAAARLARIAARPREAPPAAAVVVPPELPAAETDAGFARSRLTPAAISDAGIEAFRPDQQRAIRQYLDRLGRERNGHR